MKRRVIIFSILFILLSGCSTTTSNLSETEKQRNELIIDLAGKCDKGEKIIDYSSSSNRTDKCEYYIEERDKILGFQSQYKTSTSKDDRIDIKAAFLFLLIFTGIAVSGLIEWRKSKKIQKNQQLYEGRPYLDPKKNSFRNFV